LQTPSTQNWNWSQGAQSLPMLPHCATVVLVRQRRSNVQQPVGQVVGLQGRATQVPCSQASPV